MTPLFFLSLIVLVSAAGSLVNLMRCRRWQQRLLAMASEYGMAYSQYDRFALADRVAEQFPIPGVASLRVIDLLYSSEAKGYRYLFSAEYTIGVIRSKSRSLRAVTFFESRDSTDGAIWSRLTLAPPEMELIDQYRHLAAAFAATPPKSLAVSP